MTEAMPRKTRQEKIHARLRHEMTGSPPLFSFVQKPAASSTPTDSHFKSIRYDIGKTLILGSLFLLFEIGLAFFSPKFGW